MYDHAAALVDNEQHHVRFVVRWERVRGPHGDGRRENSSYKLNCVLRHGTTSHGAGAPCGVCANYYAQLANTALPL